MRFPRIRRCRWHRLLSTLALVTVAACSDDTGTSPEPASSQPNILFILVDDMGYNDLGINGDAPGQTPRLDQLAREGIRYTRNYVDSTCSATRAGILTGRPPASVGFRPNGLGLSPQVQTLPELLQGAGYTTHHIGKWHLGYASRLAWPDQHGYDSFFGFLNQFLLRGPHREGTFRVAKPTYRNPWLQQDAEFPIRHTGHLSDLLLARVLTFLETAPARDAPWFLSYWTYLPHDPLQPPPAFAEQFPDTFRGKYLASLAQMDTAIGAVLDALEQHGLSDSTLVVFASDNGATSRQPGSNDPFAGAKMTYLEGGVRTPLLIRWPDGSGSGAVVDELVSYLDYLPTMATAAGADVPAGLAGRDLRGQVRGEALESRPLYWLGGEPGWNTWSMLSADGRWRINQFFDTDVELYDLDRDPASSENLFDRYPAIGQRMQREFTRWHEDASRVGITVSKESEHGHGTATGSALQRAPGFGGFTFAIAVRPQTGGPAEQVIASQRGQWQLLRSGDQLKLTMNDIALSAPAPAAGACSTLVVTSQHRWNPFNMDKSNAQVELYVNGERVASTESTGLQMHPDTYAEPTFIGQNPNRQALFNGRLSEPLILNERSRKGVDTQDWEFDGFANAVDGLCRGV